MVALLALAAPHGAALAANDLATLGDEFEHAETLGQLPGRARRVARSPRRRIRSARA
jgi:hypothetical protein